MLPLFKYATKRLTEIIRKEHLLGAFFNWFATAIDGYLSSQLMLLFLIGLIVEVTPCVLLRNALELLRPLFVVYLSK